MPKWVDFLVKPTHYSNYDLSCTKRGSVSPGMLIPVWYGLMNPGEIFRMNIRSLIRTNPTSAPLMGRFKVRIVTVVSNFKNYAIGLEGYRRSFDWRTFALPNVGFNFPNLAGFRYPNLVPNRAVRETSLHDYLGYARGWLPNAQQYPDPDKVSQDSNGTEIGTIYKNALPFLVYYDFYRNYLVNPQVGTFPVFVASVDDNGNTSTKVKMRSIESLDVMFEDIHKYYDGKNTGSLLECYMQSSASVNWFELLRLISKNVEDDATDSDLVQNYSVYHGGLVSTLFDPDINTQWLSTNNFARLQAVRVNSQGTSQDEQGIFTNYADIVKASSLWDFVSREIYGGGTYADHIYSQFGVHVRGDMNIPQIVHVFDSEVRFEDITAQSSSADEVLGEQAGVGRGYGQSSRFTIRNLEKNYAYAMTFMWITPIIDYSTGLPEDSHITSFKDLYSPSFDNYSMQPRLFENMDAEPLYESNTGVVVDPFEQYGENDPNGSYTVIGTNMYPVDTPIGYQPAWSEYKTAVNRVHGLFTHGLSYWTILRKMPRIGKTIDQFTTFPVYVYQSPEGAMYDEKDAIQYYVPFSVENEDNFFYQIRFDIVASRPMSKSVLPHVK